jgi:hypothetical protein
MDNVQVWDHAVSPGVVAQMAATPPVHPTPLIMAMSASQLTIHDATVTWRTDDPSTTRIEYGTTPEYGSTIDVDQAPNTLHTATLAQLLPTTVYHYRVVSRDNLGNVTWSNDFTFTTATPDTTPPRVESATFSELTAPLVATIRFSEPVTDPSSPGIVWLTNDTAGGSTVDPATYKMHYDAATRTLTLTLASASGWDGRFTLHISAAAVRDLAGNPLDGNGDGIGGDDFNFTFQHLTGDANSDGTVGFSDLLILAKNYGHTGGTFAQGDFNYDGVVNFADLLILAKNYTRSLPPKPAPSAPIPPVSATAVANVAPTIVAGALPASDTQVAASTMFSTKRIVGPPPVSAKVKQKAVPRRAPRESHAKPTPQSPPVPPRKQPSSPPPKRTTAGPGTARLDLPKVVARPTAARPHSRRVIR